MADKLTKLGTGLDNQDNVAQKERMGADSEGKEILETKSNVSEGVNVLSENADEGGVFSEQEQKAKNEGSQSRAIGQAQTQIHTLVKQLPPVDTMIKETMEAIEAELKKTEAEVRVMRKDKNLSPYVLNDKVKRIRFLNGLMSQLKRAAKMAEDYVVGLWKQYVGKSN